MRWFVLAVRDVVFWGLCIFCFTFLLGPDSLVSKWGWGTCSPTPWGTGFRAEDTRWFKYDRDKLWLVYTHIVPVIFEPPCTSVYLIVCLVVLECPAILVRQKEQSLKWSFGSRRTIGIEKAIAQWFTFFHCVTVFAHVRQHICASQFFPWSPRAQSKYILWAFFIKSVMFFSSDFVVSLLHT